MTSMQKTLGIVIAAGVIGLPLAMKMSADKDASASSIAKENSGSCGPTTSSCGEATSRQPGATSRLPRFVDLGTTNCAPCKVMLRVMAELEQQYPGALKIDFVNVKDQPEMLEQYGVNTIPTQIFYSPDGKELFRHIGVYPTQAVVAKWKELGYELKPRAEGK